MKKCFLVMLFLMLLVGNALAEERFDGYVWNELDEKAKAVYLLGFMLGHRQGQYDGLVEGIVKGQLETMMELEKVTNVKIDKDFKIKMFKLTGDKIMNDEIPISTYKAPEPLKMIRELDAFYKTYPLCMSKRLDLMLSEFIKVWRNEDRKTFKEIGEGCAEQKQ